LRAGSNIVIGSIANPSALYAGRHNEEADT